MSYQTTEAASEADADWPEEALSLSGESIDVFLRRFGVVVIDCWVRLCKHSKRMMPIFDSLARDMKGQAVFGKVDAQGFPFPSEVQGEGHTHVPDLQEGGVGGQTGRRAEP